MSGASPPAEASDVAAPWPPPVTNHLSSRLAAIIVRDLALGAPSTTAISRFPFWEALATRLNPAAQVKPVFMPSAPG